MDARIAVRFRVAGVVQGVGFRASTRRQARSLGLDGYARNCSDGSVEVLAAGTPEAVDRLRAWLTHGPPSARVARVDSQPVEPGQLPMGFVVH